MILNRHFVVSLAALVWTGVATAQGEVGRTPCLTFTQDGEVLKTVCESAATDLHIQWEPAEPFPEFVFTSDGNEAGVSVPTDESMHSADISWRQGRIRNLRTRNSLGLYTGRGFGPILRGVEERRGLTINDIHFGEAKIVKVHWTFRRPRLPVNVDVPDGANDMHLELGEADRGGKAEPDRKRQRPR